MHNEGWTVSMTLDELSEYIANQYGARPEYAFKRYPDIAVFKRADNRKWFALATTMDCKTLGLAKSGRVDILNVKLDPLVVASLLTRKGFLPAWHMNKDHWITVLLDGSIEYEEIYTFIDMSFSSVGPKSRKKLQRDR